MSKLTLKRGFSCDGDMDTEVYSVFHSSVPSPIYQQTSDCNLSSKENRELAAAIAASPELLSACKRALPWLGKLIADGGHLESVAPNDAIGAMEQLEAAIKKAEGK